jgi:hypothetical protein
LVDTLLVANETVAPLYLAFNLSACSQSYEVRQWCLMESATKPETLRLIF